MERRLLALQKRYRLALSGAVVAKVNYLAQVGESHATPAALEQAKARWQRIETHRRRLAAELAVLRCALPPTSPPSGAPCSARNATFELAF